MEHPFVQEADLITAGFAPGLGFDAALKCARKPHLSGVKKTSKESSHILSETKKGTAALGKRIKGRQATLRSGKSPIDIPLQCRDSSLQNKPP